MAWIIGQVSDKELKQLRAIGWEDSSPLEDMLSEEEIRGTVDSQNQTRAFFVDNDVYRIMTGADWAQSNGKDDVHKE